MMQSLVFFTILLFCQLAAGSTLPSVHGPTTCEHVQLHGDELLCEDTHCDLVGHASLVCNDLELRADKIRVNITKDYGFSGARATGAVTWFDGATMVHCQSMELEGGRIRGRIENAVIQVYENRTRQGRALQTFTGEIERVSKQVFKVTDGTFTLCDCGAGNPPSWRLLASSVDIDLTNRATLWWPRFELNAFGLFALPIPLPTPVLSLPVKERALGLLAPKLTFFRLPMPTLDLPIFIPLGDSYDVTILAGLRTDWGLHRKDDVSTWAAPRLGFTFRYAPIQGLRGELSAQWTRDTHSSAARLIYLSDEHTGLEDPALLALAREDPRFGLRDRVLIGASQTYRISNRAQWNILAQWASDDYIQRDFSTHLEGQVAQYLPSRSRFSWQGERALVDAEVSYLQRLSHDEPVSASNLSAQEGALVQRAPSLSAWLRPHMLGAGIWSQASASITRFGSFGASEEYGKWLATQALSVFYPAALGPVRLNLRLAGDFAQVMSEDGNQEFLGQPRLETQAEFTLARQFGALTHMAHTFVQFQSRPAVFGNALEHREHPTLAFDSATQLSLGQRHTLHGFAAKGTSQVQMTFRQSFAPGAESKLLPGSLEFAFKGSRSFGAGIQLGFDWTNLSAGPMDMRANLRMRPWSFLRLHALYGRLYQGMELFDRSIYQFATVPTPWSGSSESWLHYLRTGLSIDAGAGWRVTYRADILFPRPVEPDLARNGHEDLLLEQSDRPRLSHQLLELAYTSNCDCWGFQLSAQQALPELSAGNNSGIFDNVRVKLDFTIGGYSLGSR